MGGGGNKFLGTGNSICEGLNPLNVLRNVSSIVRCGESGKGEVGAGEREAGWGSRA